MKRKFSKTKKQKIYKMRGCSKSKKCYIKKHRGGSSYISSIYPNKGPELLRTTGDVMSTQSGGMASSYPNGLVGSEWKPDFGWPTTSSGGNNHYPLNTYQNDLPRQSILGSANPPFSVGGRKKRRNKTSKMKPQKGGTYSNFLYQDLANFGRQIGFGLDSTYRTLSGLPGSADPLPWKGQLVAPRNIISV